MVKSSYCGTQFIALGCRIQQDRVEICFGELERPFLGTSECLKLFRFWFFVCLGLGLLGFFNLNGDTTLKGKVKLNLFGKGLY